MWHLTECRADNFGSRRLAGRVLSLLLLAGLLVGCEATEPDQPAAQVPPAPEIPYPEVTKDPAEPAVLDEEPAERVQAQVGVGAKGRSLDEEDGAVTRAIVEPARSLFATRERVIFDIQIPQAMQLYKATEGRAPQTHDEFMQKIIAANNLQLPQLPPGQRYVYDPQTEQLMVERPARQP